VAPAKARAAIEPLRLEIKCPAPAWSRVRPRERSTRFETLPLPRQQPFNTVPKLPTDPKQNLRPNLHLAFTLVDTRVYAEPRQLGKYGKIRLVAPDPSFQVRISSLIVRTERVYDLKWEHVFLSCGNACSQGFE
jgi:hypothetical protein